MIVNFKKYNNLISLCPQFPNVSTVTVSKSVNRGSELAKSEGFELILV